MSLTIPTAALQSAAAASVAATLPLTFTTTEGVDLHARLHVNPGATALVILFHGAIDFSKRLPPVFMRPGPELQSMAHCLTFSDPSLRPGIATNIAWYAGDHRCDTPRHIKTAIAAVSDALGVKRRIYHGGSGGGFAALAVSHGDPGSVVVAGAPQTRINAYHPKAVARYRAQAWPDLAADRPLSDVVVDDVTRLYAGGCANTVIVVLSLGDRRHYLRHALPLAAAVADTSAAGRFFLHADFWGEMGHVSATAEYLRWIKAATLIDQPDVEQLLMTRHALGQTAAAKPPAPRPTGGERAAFDAADLQTAALLAALRKQRNS